MITLFLACALDLPEGWEGAERVDDLTQEACAGDPYGEYDERIEVDLDDPVRVVYREAHFRCAQDVEAFSLEAGDRLDLLVQPIDMHPTEVAACDCLYDVTMNVATDAIPGTVRLYRRWDDWNEPNAPVLIGEAP